MSLLDTNPTRIVPSREVCDVNTFKIATSLIMMGIELPGQLAGVQGAAPLKQNAKLHLKLHVRSSLLERRLRLA